MAEQEVTAPDQHKPTNLKLARIGGIASIIALLSMAQPFNNHVSVADDFWLLLTAAIIAAMLIGDVVLRRVGLRP
ncbi:hypothetical protein JQS43_18140 [Natronosporangium hydrolyticum]|uniref:DUF2631 domain-containing protein n=1 Tax=Natronosporangium hydrolyticum TaxID=2811111 RepID=A0A895Y827_9ACTN|nr:hypothetical protein [Natronosporangium hydrolyticum]QSB13501.1 hypothetical protein JQS43_18140 [Natronosporangium hydrolyticum]